MKTETAMPHSTAVSNLLKINLILEKIAESYVHSSISVLTLERVVVGVELADRQTVVQSYDEVLVHDEAETCTH